MKPYKLSDGSEIDLDRVIRVGPLKYDIVCHHDDVPHIIGIHHISKAVMDVASLNSPLIVVFAEYDDCEREWYNNRDKYERQITMNGEKAYHDFLRAWKKEA